MNNEEAPKFVGLIRHYIPKEGVLTEVPNRIKNRLKKALDKANIKSEAIRGVGRKIGPFLVKFSEKDGRLFAEFEKYDPNNVPAKRTKRKKKAQLLPGRHPSLVGMTSETFARRVTALFPTDWQQCATNSHRWLSMDVPTMMNSQATVEESAQTFIRLAKKNINGPVNYTIIPTEDTPAALIGIGPV